MSRTPLHVLAKDRALRLAKDIALRFRASRALFLAKNASFPAAKHTKHTFRASPLPRAWLQHGSMDQPCAPDSKPPRTVPILLPDIQPKRTARPISWISGKRQRQFSPVKSAGSSVEGLSSICRGKLPAPGLRTRSAACVSHRQAARRSKRKMDVADTQRFTQIFCGVLPQKILTTR